MTRCAFRSPNWSPTWADTHGLMPPAPMASTASPNTRPSCVVFTARMTCPAQYTAESAKITRYLPSQASAAMAPRMGSA